MPAAEAPAELFIDASGSLDRKDSEQTAIAAVDQYEREVTNFAKIVRGEAAPFVEKE